MENIISFIVEHWDEILLAVTSIVTAASILVKAFESFAKLTSSTKDDEITTKLGNIISKILKLLNTIAMNPKEKK